MDLVVLGAGWASPGFGSSYALEVGDGGLVLVDCGPGTTVRLAEAGLDARAVAQLLLTHHHFDHSADLPSLLLTRWVLSTAEEPRPLGIAGPPRTAAIVSAMLHEETSAVRLDWRARVGYQARHGLARDNERFEERVPLDVRDVEPGDSVTDDGFRALAGPAEHVQPFLASVSWRVETPEGTVVFTGDTRPSSEVAAFAAGADCLVAMCWDTEERVAADEHLSPIVTGTLGAARMGAEAGVPLLVATHFGPRFRREQQEQARDQMAAIYSGRIVFGQQLQRIPVIER